MTRRTPRCAVLAALIALSPLGACSKGSTNQEKTERPATATAPGEVPGMSMPPGRPSDTSPGESGAGTTATAVTLTPAQVQHGNVRWAPVSPGSAAVSATVPGQLVPDEDRTSRLGAPAGGRVVTVRVQPGDRVARGQVLVTIQSPEAGMAQSDLAKARAEVTARRAQARYAGAARGRAERLLALKAIPRQDYERAVADDEAALAALAQAQAELQRSATVAEQLGASGAAAGAIALRSPLAGVVLARIAVPGTVVEPGTPLVTVTDPATLWLQVSSPERFAGLFQAGRPLRFTVPAFPTDTFAARIQAVGAGLDPDTRTLPVRGRVASAGRLKAEMLASVIVEGAGSVPGMLLPDDAVQLLDGRSVVFVAHPDGKGGARFEARPVEVASRSGGRVAITRGLAAGEFVVTQGAFAIKAQLQKGSMPEMEM
ncbi:MAG TPA: efflux RND transporter periplasmic adaptor subunit [Longimicrobiales bacterium]|nr:efflux RND transporter periplasmic adaptor subunit [Longimicrobiales bacterium]